MQGRRAEAGQGLRVQLLARPMTDREARMTFALAVILLFIAVPFLLLLLDIVSRRDARTQPEIVDVPGARRTGVIAPGEGMVHRPHR